MSAPENPSAGVFNAREQSLYEGMVHQLRARGWSRIEAEGVAIERIDGMRLAARQEPTR